MAMNSYSDDLWVEKYRPKTIADCILPKHLIETFSGFVRQGSIPNMLLSGGSGSGKTTVCRALANELDLEMLFINASEESGIDTLRTKIKSFATTVSMSGQGKAIILDEADSMNPNSLQPALRAAMEEYSKNCRFMMTCNFKNKIIAPLHSRCTCIDFSVSGKEKIEMQAKTIKRIIDILKNESVTPPDPKIIAKLVGKHYPDIRRILNEIQRAANSGNMDSLTTSTGSDAINDLIKLMKEKNFTEVRKWVAMNADAEPSGLFRELLSVLSEVITPSTLPIAYVHCGEYIYRSAFVPDHQLNNICALIQIMSDCEFK